MRKLSSILVLVAALSLAIPVQAEETKAAPKTETVAKTAPATQPVASTASTTPATISSSPVVAAPATASTTTTEEMPWWKVIIRYSLELAFTILGLLASVLVTVLMRKYGFEDYSNKVNDILNQATGLAEQKSLQALKLNGTPLGSAEKLAVALEFVSEKAKEYKLPDKGKEWWTKKVEGWIGSSKVIATTTVTVPNNKP